MSKVVVFAHHKDVVRAIASEFGNTAVTLVGDTPMAQRQAAVDRFQNDPDCQVFIGSIGAAGVGHTLTAASTVIFVELDWVPANISQAEDRCHRIGQTSSVLVQHLVLEGSIDAHMAETVIAKQGIIGQALDNEIGEMIEDDQMAALIQKAASQEVSRKRVEAQAADMTQPEIDAIHIALRILAGMCDGALELDDCGFNKLDSQIGKSLAASPRFTAKQAVLGRSIVLKYHRQIPQDVYQVISKK